MRRPFFGDIVDEAGATGGARLIGRESSRQVSDPSGGVGLVVVLALAALVAAYWIFRFDRLMMEGDATLLTQSADGIARTGRLVTELSYWNGYGYTALLAFLVDTTGLSVQTIQLAGSLWLVVVVLVAYLTYRELLGGARLGAFAVLLVLLHPDFLFYILRSSHERTTWTFGLLILWLWVRSTRTHRLVPRISIVIAFYLLLWAIIANNAYFGSTIITAFLLSTVSYHLIRLVLPRLTHSKGESVHSPEVFDTRVHYMLLSGFALLFLFITYLYSPASTYYGTMKTIGEKVALLFLGTQPASQRLAVSETYGYVQSAWTSQAVYFGLTGFQWAIVLAGAAAWLRHAVLLLRGGEGTPRPARQFVWYFYLGFACQIVLGVLSDLSGAMGSNLELRLFTPFVLVSSPMAATWLEHLDRIQVPRFAWQRPRRAQAFVAAALVAFATAAALVKATNDPVFANLWLFYSPREQVALDWVNPHISNRTIWIDTWPHQLEVLKFREGYAYRQINSYLFSYLTPDEAEQTAYVLLSDLTILRARRSDLRLPDVSQRDRVYDVGDVQLYHRRQVTPFQR